MAEYTAETHWLRGDQDFLDKRYSRRHLLRVRNRQPFADE